MEIQKLVVLSEDLEIPVLHYSLQTYGQIWRDEM